MKAPRQVWVDVAKGIGIILVVVGHTEFRFDDLLFTFHMPLFFVISGYLLNFDKWQGKLREFAISRFNRLMIPYFGCCVFLYAFWVAIGRRFGDGVEKNVSVLKPLVGIFYGNSADGWLAFDSPLWFLPCLFVAELIFICALSVWGKSEKKLLACAIAAAVAGYLIGRVAFLPWGADVALIAQPFLLLGNRIRTFDVAGRLSGRAMVMTAAAALIVLLVAYHINGMVDMNMRMFHNVPAFYAGAISGTILVLVIATFLQGLPFVADALTYCGKNSLIIMVFHALSFKAVSVVAVFLLHVPLHLMHFTYWPVYAVFGMLIPLGIAWLLNVDPRLRRFNPF